MITFGFKDSKSIYTRAAISGVLGVAFILITPALRNSKAGLFDVLVMLTGAAVALLGVVELVVALVKKDRPRTEKTRMVSSAVVSIVLGAVICGTAKLIMTVFIVLVALFLLLLGLYQIIILISAHRALRFSTGFFVLPAIVTICGAIVLIGGLTANKNMQDVMCYAAGVSLILYSISELVAMTRIRKAMDAYFAEEQEAVVVDVEPADKVDEQ